MTLGKLMVGVIIKYLLKKHRLTRKCFRFTKITSYILSSVLLFTPVAFAGKEIALTFDDAPGEKTLHFTPDKRTDELIKKLKVLNIPSVVIFANPCNGGDQDYIFNQLKKFHDNGHIIGNHTCAHSRLDDVGFDRFVTDVLNGEMLLKNLMEIPKLFRFPFFNEGKNPLVRNNVRKWLKEHGYKNFPASIENEDPIFSFKINQAKSKGKTIDYEKVKSLFLDHVLRGVDFFERLGKKTLGRPLKHNILLHQSDATVLFLDDLVIELRKRGWTIISAKDAIKDPMYLIEPQNTMSTYGLIAQLERDQTGHFSPYYDFNQLKLNLNKVLNIENK